jgi:DnaJ-class molecular chaperone
LEMGIAMKSVRDLIEELPPERQESVNKRAERLKQDETLACPACEDTGECGRCEGSGKIFNEDEALPPWSICGDCQGSGLCFECDE